MVGSSKILTVSYGTFSCTLEGFDDPFSTMKSIAEYFRDLAADDRYFGAEPPTPDADMLHRIAEREIQRRVEARVSESGIVLRQLDSKSPESRPAQPEARSPEPEEAPAAPATSAKPQSETAQSVTAKLSRIRAVVERARSEAVVPVPPPADYEDLIDEEAEAPLTRAQSFVPDAAEDAETAETDAEERDEDWSATSGAEAEDSDVGDDFAEEAAAPRIEDDMGPADEDAPVAEVAALDDGAEADLAPHAVSDDEGDGADEDDHGWDDAPAASAEPAPMMDSGDEDYEDEDEDADVADGDAPYAMDEDAESEAEDYEDELAATAEDDEEEEFAGVDHAWAESDTIAVEDDDEDEEPAPRGETIEGIAARIVKLKRADLERGLLGEDDTDNEAAMDPDLEAGIRNALDAEARALAEERKEARIERRNVLISDPDREPALNRILEETNTKMADSEGTRRRSAIAHLKAAVAATKADRLLKRQRSRDIDEEEQSAYREDLAKVVRPRRSEPRESAAAKERPQSLDEASAPLMLVSSQRVDNERPRSEPVRPRRIGAGMISIEPEETGFEEDDTGFVEFAETMGARDLPDLLEAAAAYTAFVERQPHFSRPEIMRRAASVETEEEFTREAGLRSFGQLLRQGKIRKLQRGQFTIADNTRFKPESRIAGE